MGFFVRKDEKSGRCREVAVSGRSTVLFYSKEHFTHSIDKDRYRS